MRWLAAGLLAGCNGQVTLDGSPDTESGTEAPACDGADPFVVGISAATPAGRTVAISAAAPTPPDVGDNTWTLEVTDGAGPVTGLTVVVTPWMPLHDHGLVPPDYAATESAPGAYDVETFDLIMPGLWEFTVDLGGDPADAAVFRFCAEG